MRWGWLVVVCVASGCYESNMLTCGDTLCPHDKVCSPITTCVDPAQLDACEGTADGSACTTPAISTGVCVSAICLVAGCGNGFVEPGEACDDGNHVSFDGCRADCASNEVCGDGIADPLFGEACDCGTPGRQSATCLQPNNQMPGAECREDCKLARCGDSIIDPNEICDDGNTISGDGCRGDCQGRFTKMQTTTANRLERAWTTGTDAWAVGDGGTVIYYDGTTWVDIAPNDTTNFIRVWASGPHDVYVVTNAALVRHYDGTSWTTVPTGVANVAEVWGTSASDVFVIGGTSGNGDIAHYDGTSWSPVAICPELTSPLVAITGTGPNRIFVGDGEGVCRYNGTAWTFIAGGNYSQLAAVAGSDVYGLVPNTPSVERWTQSSSTWTSIAVPGSLNAIATTGAGTVLGCGDAGIVLDRKNQIWTNYAAPTEQTLNGVAATSDENVFIVGAHGTILH